MALTDILKTDAGPPRVSDPSGALPDQAGARRRLLTPEDAESLRRLGVEIEVTSPFGPFWIVPERTESDRVELTPEDVVALVNIVRIFGGKLVGLTRNGKPLVDVSAGATAEEFAPEPPGDPDPDSAREHLRRLREQAAPTPAQPTPPEQADLFPRPTRRA